MEIKHVLLFISLLVPGLVTAEPDTDDLQGDDYHMESHQNGTEQEVTILDKDGRAVGKVDMFADEGYQIEKPIDGEEHLCLLRTNDRSDEESNQTNICYVRRAVSHEEAIGLNMPRILDHCGNRSIYTLEPQDCDRIDNTDTGNNRRRRSWPVGNYCCHYKPYISVRCVISEVRCTRTIFGICLRWCRVCVEYAIVVLTQKLCHYG
ncbi:uncharacterized protein LOC123558761 [Mercenaria mercenaria]|uniref:uncharacterized protein LOC123558761 n=1 Tax=Mercenaria mercenaria TaxID=6596 RepID=UPI00234E8E2D|nr:uncharacterized protein LOC123558761 [Mercenaria mercenaria]XP_045206564.2 uncharacterized protein LOC123558761 [Mercenaria mercenaria]